MGATRTRTTWPGEPSARSVATASGAPGYLNWFAVRDGPHKLLLDGKSLQLFDVDADPGETTDLSEAHPDVVARMLRRYDDWRLETSRIPRTTPRLSGSVTRTEPWASSGSFELAYR